MSKKTQRGAYIKPKHTNLNRNPEPRLPAEAAARLSSEFGFRSAYDLRAALNEAIAGYRKLTGQTQLRRQRQRSSTKHWLKIASKRAQRGDRKRFRSSLKKASPLDVMYMAIGGSNPLRDPLDKSAQAGKAALEMMKRSGRPKDDSALLIYGLIHIYEKGTGKRAGMPNANMCDGPFFRFATEVFNLAGIEIEYDKNDDLTALAKQIQRRIKESRCWRSMRGSQR